MALRKGKREEAFSLCLVSEMKHEHRGAEHPEPGKRECGDRHADEGASDLSEWGGRVPQPLEPCADK